MSKIGEAFAHFVKENYGMEVVFNKEKEPISFRELFGGGVSDSEFRKAIIDYFLEDWYVSDPIDQMQVNELALKEIMARYAPK